MTVESPWTPERDAELTRLYATGLSYSAIAEKLGVSRSAAIGRGHRLDLTPRASPIKPRQAAGDGPAAGGCRFPLWPDSSRPTHHYCGAPPIAVGEPYCKPHRDRCWQGTPVRPLK